MAILVLLGRLFFSVIFIFSGFFHFTQTSIQMAASQGVPYAFILVPLSGVLAILGGLSILLGYKARWELGPSLSFLFRSPYSCINFGIYLIEGAML